jgi:hypothetical protein
MFVPQLVPSVSVGFEHTPPLHVPAPWQESLAGHALGVPTHAPLWQVGVSMHASVSVHGVLFARAGLLHWPLAGSHVPGSWH